MVLSDSLSDSFRNSVHHSKNKYPFSTLTRHAKRIITFRIFAPLTHTDIGCFKMSQLRSEVLVCHHEKTRERNEEKWEEKLAQYIYTVRTLCNYLGISRATLYRLIQKGQLEPLHIGSSTRFTENEVNNFITRQQKLSRIKEVGF
jgi:excisionase family DNA binding protein